MISSHAWAVASHLYKLIETYGIFASYNQITSHHSGFSRYEPYWALLRWLEKYQWYFQVLLPFIY